MSAPAGIVVTTRSIAPAGHGDDPTRARRQLSRVHAATAGWRRCPGSPFPPITAAIQKPVGRRSRMSARREVRISTIPRCQQILAADPHHQLCHARLVPTHGQTSPFIERPWDELADVWSERARSGVPVAHLVAIVESVIAAGAATQLAAASSLYDLIVVDRPIPEPPHSMVIVRSPVSVRPSAAGKVVIEHCSLTGRIDRIERPTSDAVPLFWRFMIEKFGIDPRQLP